MRLSSHVERALTKWGVLALVGPHLGVHSPNGSATK